MESQKTLTLTISPHHNTYRVDKVLTQAVPELSRTRLQSLIKNQNLSINHTLITDPSYLVKTGQNLVLHIPPPTPSHITPQPIPLNILFEDNHLLVINKPPGLPVHIAPGHPDNTLVNALLAHCGTSLSGIGGVCRPGIVHRLDKDTSGLLLVAKNDPIHQKLSQQFAARTIQRTYHGLVWGIPQPLQDTIYAPIGRHPFQRQKMTVLKNAGKYAQTSYRTQKTFAQKVSYVEFSLSTGRTHQIRVHISHKGYPLIGDPLYSPTKKRFPKDNSLSALHTFPRQALHAISIQFIHPQLNKTLHFHTTLPEDLQNLITLLNTLS